MGSLKHPITQGCVSAAAVFNQVALAVAPSQQCRDAPGTWVAFGERSLECLAWTIPKSLGGKSESSSWRALAWFYSQIHPLEWRG